ncbi:MAG: hypothetical protein ACF8Q5_13180 [Phycisphaerales bacterium JB040]
MPRVDPKGNPCSFESAHGLQDKPWHPQTRLLTLLITLLTLAPSALATPELTAVETRIRAVVRAMDDAMDNADTGKYMTHVDPDLPLLLAEQRAWATNLRERRPIEIDFTLVEGETIELVEGGAEAEVLLAWTPRADQDENGRRPEKLEVPFRARFEPLYPVGENPEDIRWVFSGVAWEVELHAPDGSRVLAFEHDRAMAESMLEVLPDALASAAACFNAKTPVATVKLYPTMELLNASISPGLTAPIAGWNEPGEAIKLAAPALAEGETGPGGPVAVLVHEAAHCVQFAHGERPTRAPWWVLEGSAERAASLFSGEQDWPSVDGMVRGMARFGGLADFDDLAEYDERMPSGAIRAYLQGHHFVRWLDETRHPGLRNQWLKFLLDGATLDEASRLIYQAGFDELDQSWRASLTDESEPDNDGEAGGAGDEESPEP